MGSPSYVGALCLLLAIAAGISQALEVDDSSDLVVLESGTRDAVVLDCPYTVSEDDLGLLVKWYHSESPVPVYQWIPGGTPQAMGILENRLDLEYKASEDENYIHSALRILNPTTELHGVYTCQVSTFDVEHSVERELVVYSKPHHVHVTAEEEGEDQVKVVCEVDNIFPQPEIKLNMMVEEDGDKTVLEGASVEPSWSEGFFSSKVELMLEEDPFDGPVHFECEVTIPQTELAFQNRTHYEPRVFEVAGAVMSGSGTRSALAVTVSLAFLAVWRL